MKTLINNFKNHLTKHGHNAFQVGTSFRIASPENKGRKCENEVHYALQNVENLHVIDIRLLIKNGLGSVCKSLASGLHCHTFCLFFKA